MALGEPRRDSSREDLLVAEIGDRLQLLGVQSSDHGQVLGGGRPQQLHERRQALRVRVLGIGDRQSAHDLREVAVAGRADHQGLRLGALLVLGIGTEPRASLRAGGHGGPDLGLGQPTLSAACVAAHHDLGEVAAAALGQLELGVGTARSLVVHEQVPREVAEVPAPARGHEANGRGVPLGAPQARVAVGLVLVVELVLAHQRVAALAHEPPRELEGLDPQPGIGAVAIAGWRGPKGRIGRQLDPILVDRLGLQGVHHPRAQPGFGDPLASPRAHRPQVEASDQHRVVDEIDHGAGTEGRDDLALPDLALGSLLVALAGSSTSHDYRPPRIAPRSTQMCTVLSTSRMEVGAVNLRSCSPSPPRSSIPRSSALPSRTSS